MALLPKLKIKSIPQFPATVDGGDGISVAREGGEYTIGLELGDFAPPASGISDPVNETLLMWNSVTGIYTLAPVSLFGAGGGVPEAATDGVTYGRKDAAWEALPDFDLFAPLASPAFTGNPTAPTPIPGDNDTSIATTAFVTEAVVASGGTLPSNDDPLMDGVAAEGVSALYSRSDHVHPSDTARAPAAVFDALAYNGMQVNGSMEVSQELGTGGTAVGAICDGWKIFKNGTMAVYAGQIATSVAPGFNHVLGVGVTTATPTLVAGEWVQIVHRIEGWRTARVAWGTASAQPITIAFWSKHVRTGVHTIVVANEAGTRSYAASYTQAVSDVAQYNAITIPGCPDGAWVVTNTVGIEIRFAMACFSGDAAPSLHSWLVGNYSAGLGQVNGVASLSDAFRLTGVVVLPGIEAPSAERSSLIMRPYDQELVMCQRYFNRFGGNGIAYEPILQGRCNASTEFRGVLSYPQMRSAPTFTFSANSTFVIGIASSAVVSTGLTASTVSSKKADMQVVCDPALTPGHGATILANNTALAWINLDARL